MPVYNEPQRTTWGQGLTQSILAYLQGRQQRRQEKMESQRLGIEQALAKQQGQYYGARAEAALQPREQTGSDVLNMLRSRILERMTPEQQEQYLLKPSTSVTTNVNTGTSPLEKSTKGALEREITDISDILGLVDTVSKLTEDEFLTYGGKITKGVTRADEMLGSKVNLPGADPEFLARYSRWKLPAQEIYLKKRHEITGVAANPAEKAEIAEAIPDPSKNTPTEYRSKLAQLKRLLMQAQNRKIMFRSAGIENPTPEQLSSVPLKDVPLDPKQATKKMPKNMTELSVQGGTMAKEKLMKIREGLPDAKKAAFDVFWAQAKNEGATDEEVLAEYMKGRK